MKNYLRSLGIVSLFHLLSASLGTALAVREDLPAEFGGFLRGHNVFKDFIFGSGTALSPPLFMLVLQVVFLILLTRREALRRIGLIGLIVLGGLYFLGQLGEPVLWRLFTPGGFDWLRAILVAANLLLPLLMVYFGLRASRQTP